MVHGRYEDAPDPKLSPRQAAFNQVLEYLEEHWDEGITLQDLNDKMVELVGDSYTSKWIRELLLKKYGDEEIVIIENMIIFRRTRNKILTNFAKASEANKSSSVDDKARSAIKLACDIIVSDMKSHVTMNRDSYFSVTDLNINDMLEYLPDSLRHFFACLQHRKRRGDNRFAIASLGQSLIKFVRPRGVHPPLQVAYCAEIHNKTGNKYLVSLSNAMGHGSSYDETLRFQQCAAGYAPDQTDVATDRSDIYSGDNADADPQTLYGMLTLHVLGMTQSTLRKASIQTPLSRTPPTREQLRAKMIPTYMFTKAMLCELSEAFGPWIPDPAGNETYKSLYTCKLDMLRISAALLKPIPRTAGFMRSLTKHNATEAAHTVNFLPFIDLSPADMSSLYTAMLFVIKECEKHKQQAIIYFDQPLWWNSMLIKQAKNLDITIVVGNFHFQMCFLSVIGDVMKNTGLEALLGVIYGDNTVKRIMAGKSYKRAMRAHSLISTVLKKILLSQVGFADQYHAVKSRLSQFLIIILIYRYSWITVIINRYIICTFVRLVPMILQRLKLCRLSTIHFLLTKLQLTSLPLPIPPFSTRSWRVSRFWLRNSRHQSCISSGCSTSKW